MRRLIRKISCVVNDNWVFCIRAGSITKVLDFVHVKPNTWKFDFRVEHTKHIFPVLSSFRVEIINKNRISWPNCTYKLSSVQIFHENIPGKAYLIGFWFCWDSCVDDGNVVIFFNDILHGIQGEIFFIDSEIFEISHIVYVAPDCVKWKTKRFVFR